MNGRHDVLVQRLARRARLLGAVEDGDRADAWPASGDEAVSGEGPVQADLQDSDSLTALVQSLHRLGDRLAAGAHDDDHAVCFWIAGVVEQSVVPTDDL